MTDSDMEDFESADEGEEVEPQEKSEVDKPTVKSADVVESVTTATEALSLKTEQEQEAAQSQTSPVCETSKTVKETSSNEQNADLSSVFDKLTSDKPKENTSAWGWGSWGASIVSTATASVSTLTSQIGEGLNTVLESVEDVLGAPPPEQLAEENTKIEKIEASETPMVNNESKERADQGLFSTLTGVLEKTGTKVITTGLDTLELLGKKTMDVLQEGDPGLKNKRSLFQGSKSSLSEVLREAKAQADAKANLNETAQQQRANYSVLFDSHQGLIHLEALEMLSEESKDRLPSLLALLSTENQTDIKEELQEIEEVCTLDNTEDEDKNGYDFTDILTNQAPLLHPDLKVSRLREVYERHQSCLKNYEAQIIEKSSLDREEMHSDAIEFLAEFTAVTMEILHKLAELILLGNSTENDTSNKISSIIKIFCCEIDNAANKYSEVLNNPSEEEMEPEDQDKLKILTTEIFLEASNSSTYIADALHLLIPILQVSFIERFQD